jgi:ABC-type Mn2+/Zn2+ transport system permease subunit
LVTFGFLLIPPLIAHLFARNMRQFALAASGVGGFSALVGFYLAYKWDLPVGPVDVALLGLVYGLVFVGKKILGALRPKAGDAASPTGVQA